ncbi:isopentenyl-diphosphate Delta-isomerase [Candidatus Peregrinibacteria bacterium]|nr:isopentenyl-diphosphate Delta-isomerase [Candidatus Peregrinibacteria bacterium]
MTARLILVDAANAAVGLASWEDVHAFPEGRLHRAFSVYIFRNNGAEILVQRRSQSKLFAGLWANACCSHPREGENDMMKVAERRLNEELGFACHLSSRGSFVYRAEDPAGRGAEYEHVTLFSGNTDDVNVKADPREVMEWKWMNMENLQKDMAKNPQQFAPWFHIGLEQLLEMSAMNK